MILHLHENFQHPLVIKATRLLITKDDNTPIAFAVEQSKNHLTVFHVGDKDFNEQLKAYGFKDSVIVNHIKP